MERHQSHRTTSTALALVLASLIAPVTSATAQVEAEAATLDLETVVVTGSRIRRNDETASSPIQTLDEDDLRLNGSVSLGETLQTLPSVGASLNLNGSAGTSHGSSSLNLRNLGENRSLVLVNGHRWVNGAGTRGFRDFVDLNTIPQVIIKDVEVLQDGATAIYGADAIAGVVNFSTYTDFEGTRLRTYYGQSGEGDRETVSGEALFGKTWGSSNWMLALSYVDQKPIFSQDRSLTAVPLNGLSTGTPEGHFRESGLSAAVGFPVPSAGLTRDPGADGSIVGNWRAVDTATDVFNRYDNNYVVGPLTIWSAYLQNKTELSDDLEFTFEFLYNERESDQLFSGAAPVIRGSRGFTIPNDPSVNPFGITFSGSDFRIENFFEDVGQRDNKQSVKTTRIGAGLAGDLSNGWHWDTFASWGKNSADFTSTNQIDLDRLALGMRACNTAGIASDVSDLAAGCVPVNLFNPLTAAMVDYIRYTGRDTNSAEQVDFTANLTGELFDLPAGPLSFATGYEYRREQGLDTPDSYNAAQPRVNTYQTTTSAPRDGTDGEYDLNELYVEFDVPLLSDQPMAKDLRLQAATRYSDYSTFGSTTNSKLGVLWRPVEDLMFRSTWAEGFRAPSIVELFEGTRQTFVPVADPCSGNTGLPGCAGVPSGYVQPNTNVSATVGGNPALQPETSENITIGLVATPSQLPGFSVTLDWYKIEIDDTISNFGAQNLLNLCSVTGQRCNFITREASGEIESIADGPINLNQTQTEGIDFVARYATEAPFGGDLEFMLSTSRLLDFTEKSSLPNGSILVTDKVGTAASREAFPEWRSMFTAQWRGETWSANYKARHIGETDEMVAGSARRIPSILYHDISTGYRFNDAVSIKVGVDNILDQQPPRSLTNLNINFDIATYNAVGRFAYVQLTWNPGN